MAVGKVSDADFEARKCQGDRTVRGRFSGRTAGPRRMIAPALDGTLSGAMGDKVKIVKLNVDESPKTASKYGVTSIPTLMIFKGGEMASRQVGAAPKFNRSSDVHARCGVICFSTYILRRRPAMSWLFCFQRIHPVASAEASSG